MSDELVNALVIASATVAVVTVAWRAWPAVLELVRSLRTRASRPNPAPVVPLSEETIRRVEALFEARERAGVIDLLANECGGNLPFCENATPESSERIRFAVLKLSDGRMDALRRAVEHAKVDWRDILVDAGFGDDMRAHTKWEPRPVSDQE